MYPPHVENSCDVREQNSLNVSSFLTASDLDSNITNTTNSYKSEFSDSRCKFLLIS